MASSPAYAPRRVGRQVEEAVEGLRSRETRSRTTFRSGTFTGTCSTFSSSLVKYPSTLLGIEPRGPRPSDGRKIRASFRRSTPTRTAARLDRAMRWNQSRFTKPMLGGSGTRPSVLRGLRLLLIIEPPASRRSPLAFVSALSGNSVPVSGAPHQRCPMNLTWRRPRIIGEKRSWSWPIAAGTSRALFAPLTDPNR